MEEGRIIEHGSHQELLAAQGHYADMWALQQEERAQALEKELNQKLSA